MFFTVNVYALPDVAISTEMLSFCGITIFWFGRLAEPYKESFIVLVTAFVLSNEAIHEIRPPRPFFFT